MCESNPPPPPPQKKKKKKKEKQRGMQQTNLEIIALLSNQIILK
jgi:hypothetical protein